MTKVTRWGTVISYYCYEINFCFCYFWQGWQGGLLLLFWKIFCPHYKYKYISNVSTDRCGWSSMQGCLAHSFLQLRQGDPPPPHPLYLWFYHLIKVQIFRYAYPSQLVGWSVNPSHFHIFHCVGVSEPLQSNRRPRDVICFLKAMTNSFQMFPYCTWIF